MTKREKYRLMSFIVAVVLIITAIPLMLLWKHNSELRDAFGYEIKEPTCYIEELELTANLMQLPDGDYDIDFFIEESKFLKPNLGYVNIINQCVVDYEFYFDDYCEQRVDGSVTTSIYDVNKLYSIELFGAVGDGKTDNTEALKKASEFINENGGILYFPTGNYIVSAPVNRYNVLEINSDKEVIVDFLGSTITMTPNAHPRYVICYAVDTENIIVKNGHLVGDRLGHQFVDGKYEYKTHAHGVGIYFRNTSNGLIYNIESSQFTGDSLCVTNGQSGGTIVIDQCNLHHSRRQGITVLDGDQILIKNTEIHHIGDFDGVMGTAPRSGIDIEPDSGTFVVNKVVIDNVNIHDVGHYGIVTNKNKERVYAPDLTVVNSIIEKPCFNYASVDNCRFNFTKNWSILLKDNNIQNTKFYMDTNGNALFMEGGVTNNCVYEASRNSDISDGRIFFYDTLVTNCHFDGILGRGNFSTRSNADYGIILFGDQGALAEDSKNNTFDSCSIYARDTKISKAKLKDCVLYTSSSVEFVEFEMYDGYTLSSEEAVNKFTDCRIVNAGTFEKCIKIMKNCYFEFVSSNGAFGSGSTIENTKLVVTGNATINTFYGIESCDEKSSIEILQYSNERLIDSSNSNCVRAIARYLGDKKLTYYLDK